MSIKINVVTKPNLLSGIRTSLVLNKIYGNNWTTDIEHFIQEIALIDCQGFLTPTKISLKYPEKYLNIDQKRSFFIKLKECGFTDIKIETQDPFIIQAGLSETNYILTVNGGCPKIDTRDLSLEDIVEGLLEVPLPSRSKRLQQMYDVAKQYYAILEESKGLDSDKKSALKIQLDELSAPFSDKVAYHAWLEMERIAAGIITEEETLDKYTKM